MRKLEHLSNAELAVILDSRTSSAKAVLSGKTTVDETVGRVVLDLLKEVVKEFETRVNTGEVKLYTPLRRAFDKPEHPPATPKLPGLER